MWMFVAVAHAAEPQWHQLRTEGAAASSFLKSNWNKYDENYHPNYAFDDNPATAWVEGVEGDGVGQVLSWDTSALSTARAVKLRIRDGYQKSDALLAANGMPTKVKVDLWQGRHRVLSKEADLEPTSGWQEIVLDTAGMGFAHVEVTILAVRPGTKYADTCISDIEVWVDSKIPYDAGLEQARHSRLKAWIAERIKTARYFASLPQTYPFAGSSFTEQDLAVDAAAFEAAAKPLRDASTTLESGPTSRPAVKGAIEALPDGLADVLAPVRELLRAGDVTFFETPDAVLERVEEECDGECWEQRSTFRVASAERTLQHARFTTEMVSGGRSDYAERVDYTVSWDAAGHLVGVRSVRKRGWVNHYDPVGSTDAEEEVLVSLVWTGDRVTRVERRTASREQRGDTDWTALAYEGSVWVPAS